MALLQGTSHPLIANITRDSPKMLAARESTHVESKRKTSETTILASHIAPRISLLPLEDLPMQACAAAVRAPTFDGEVPDQKVYSLEVRMGSVGQCSLDDLLGSLLSCFWATVLRTLWKQRTSQQRCALVSTRLSSSSFFLKTWKLAGSLNISLLSPATAPSWPPALRSRRARTGEEHEALGRKNL